MKALLLALALVACSKSDAPQHDPVAATKATKDPAKAKQMIASGALVLDVRSPDEFSTGHLSQATNMPIQDFSVPEVDKLAAGDKAKPVVVYCAAGGRAAKAKEKLEAAGYTNVVNGGGYDDLH
jgi:phage shock protein E